MNEPTTNPAASVEVAVMAFDISAFCKRNGISRGMYYKMKKQGLGPTEFRVGTKPLISHESDAAWRRRMEALNASADNAA